MKKTDKTIVLYGRHIPNRLKTKHVYYLHIGHVTLMVLDAANNINPTPKYLIVLLFRLGIYVVLSSIEARSSMDTLVVHCKLVKGEARYAITL